MQLLCVLMYVSSSITSGEKAITIGDTVLINSHSPSEPFVGEIRSFHESLTDGQACADIFWYFRPKEMNKLISKIPKSIRPNLPSLADTEVVVSDINDTIEVSTISGSVYIHKVDPSTPIDSVDSIDLVARFHYNSIRRNVSHLFGSSCKSSIPNELSRNNDIHDGIDPVSDLENLQKRVRFRSKGGLRPDVPCCQFNRKLHPCLPKSFASSSDVRKGKKSGYLGLLSTPSRPLPRFVSPSTVNHDPSSPLKEGVVSHNGDATFSSLNSLKSDPLVEKRRISYSLKSWIGKGSSHSSNAGAVKSSGVFSSGGDNERSSGGVKGLIASGKGSLFSGKGKLSSGAFAAKRPPCKRTLGAVTSKKTLIGEDSSASSATNPCQSPKKKFKKQVDSDLNMFEVFEMIFDSDSEEVHNELEEGVGAARNNSLDHREGKSGSFELDPLETSKSFEQDPLVFPTKESTNSTQMVAKKWTKSRSGRGSGDTVGIAGKEAKCKKMEDINSALRKPSTRGSREEQSRKKKTRDEVQPERKTPVTPKRTATTSEHTPINLQTKTKMTSTPIRSSSRKKSVRLSNLVGMDEDEESDSGSYNLSGTDEGEMECEENLEEGEVEEWTPKFKTPVKSRAWAEVTPKSSKRIRKTGKTYSATSEVAQCVHECVCVCVCGFILTADA